MLRCRSATEQHELQSNSVNVTQPMFLCVQTLGNLTKSVCFLFPGIRCHCSSHVKSSAVSFWRRRCVLTVSSLLFSVLRSPETGAGGENLSSAETSKHRWVCLWEASGKMFKSIKRSCTETYFSQTSVCFLYVITVYHPKIMMSDHSFSSKHFVPFLLRFNKR